VAAGAWSKQFGHFGIATVVLIAVSATFFCNALGVRPPGAYFVTLAGALGREAPEHLPLGKHGFSESLRESLVWPSPVLVVSLRVARRQGWWTGIAVTLPRQ
jgi:hypothetical protein